MFYERFDSDTAAWLGGEGLGADTAAGGEADSPTVVFDFVDAEVGIAGLWAGFEFHVEVAKFTGVLEHEHTAVVGAHAFGMEAKAVHDDACSREVFGRHLLPVHFE